MGLDVYLYRSEDRAAAKALEERYEAESTAAWNFDGRKYEQLTEAEKDSASARTKRIAAELGLDEYGSSKSCSKIELPSVKHPKHYFKIGYLRSSYNESGINNYLRRLGLPDLGEIFGYDEEYEFTPDWVAVKERASEVLARLNEKDTSFDIFEVSANPFGSSKELPSTPEQVRQLFLDEKTRQGDGGFESYQNGIGTFSKKGYKVLGFVPGWREFLSRKLPCVYVVYQSETDEDGDFYSQALEIVIENCEYVLSQPDPQHYYLHWSG